MYSFELIKLNINMRATNIFIPMSLTEFICVYLGVPQVSLLLLFYNNKYCYYFIMTA